MVTIRDVAKEADVSVATVSRVINDTGYVNENTKLKVLKKIRELEYQPNLVARGLAGKRIGMIALILPDITNPFFGELARAVEDKARKLGLTVFLCNSDDQGDKEKSYIDILKRKYVDGIIFASNTIQQEDIKELQKCEMPIVVIDRASTIEGCNVIKSKNYLGAKMAINHLLDVGCKKIAHIYGPQEFITAKERRDGYEAMVKDFNWYEPSLMIGSDFTIEGGREAVRTLYKNHSDIDGVFAGNDLIAIGALKELHSMGISIPEEVAICGFDGIKLTEITEPELSTISQSIYDVGTLAVKIIDDELNDKTQLNKFYELDVKLIQRGSTKRI